MWLMLSEHVFALSARLGLRYACSGAGAPARWRYGCQRGSTRPTATTIHTVSCGTEGFRLRLSPTSAGRRSSFMVLQRLHAATTLSHVCVPPRLRGTTWSTFSAWLPQY